jgi:hypothetical protein
MDLEQLAARSEPAILFFNSGRWIEGLRILFERNIRTAASN